MVLIINGQYWKHVSHKQSLNVKKLTALCKWDSQGRPSPPKAMMHFPPVSDFPLFTKICLSPWENFPILNFSLCFRKKFISPLFSKISPVFVRFMCCLPDLPLFPLF